MGNQTGGTISIPHFINQQLSRYVAVRRTTMLDACVLDPTPFGRPMVSCRKLRKYIQNGVMRRKLESRKRRQKCLLCLEEQRVLPVKACRLTNGLYRMPCCAAPVHPVCFWNQMYVCPQSIKCDTPLRPEGVPHWMEIMPPRREGLHPV